MKTMNYDTQKIIKMSFLSFLSFPRKRESRCRPRENRKLKNWIPCQARNNRQEYLFTNKGFTLIELIITLVLIGIVAFIVADAMSTGFRAYFVTDNRKEALDQARIAMERMTREIRNVSTKGKDNDSDGYMDADITTATATSFCFTNVNGTTISFSLSGTNILRGEGGCPPGSTNTLASNVTALNLRYVLANGNTTSAPGDPTDIRRIQIGWSGTPGISVTVNNETVSLSSEIYLRNMQ